MATTNSEALTKGELCKIANECVGLTRDAMAAFKLADSRVELTCRDAEIVVAQIEATTGQKIKHLIEF